jgi:soluble lytic murein transglycosylase-like protein
MSDENNYIAKASVAYGTPVSGVIKAVIKQESTFCKDVESPVRALGINAINARNR